MPDVFDKLRLTPGQLRAVAERRFGDAMCLLDSRKSERANGAIYMAGFVIECLLKSLLLQRHRNLQKSVDLRTMSKSDREVYGLLFSHRLDAMLGFLPELQKKFANVKTKSGRSLWHAFIAICAEWTIYVRYSPHVVRLDRARDFVDSVREVKKMAHATLVNPPYVAKLTAELKRKITGAKVKTEYVRRNRYTFIVVSGKFDRMGHPERQRMVWDIAESVLPRPDLLNVAMILTIGVKELPSYQD